MKTASPKERDHIRPKLLAELWSRQQVYRHIRDEDISELADNYKVSKVEIEGVVSFYHFLHRKPAGTYTIYLNDSILSEFGGYAKIREVFEQTCNTKTGGVDPTGMFGLFSTSCIGMSDQEPACLINFYPFTRLTPQKVHRIVQHLKSGGDLADLYKTPTCPVYKLINDPEDALFFRDYQPGAILQRLKELTPEEALELIRVGQVPGMGGAFFPVASKWQNCRDHPDPVKYIVCNADEGEPGTFKDRILMQELPGLLLEGMILSGYITAARAGYIYLRAEYAWLLPVLESAIADFRSRGWLGKNIQGKQSFSFDIMIQLGAGAYVCGEETALLQSMEGKRGEPRAKIFFPTEKGYLGKPTVVNNVESFYAAARCVELGPEVFINKGTERSKGHKLLSVSGDCRNPGIYEIEWGLTLGALLEQIVAKDPYAIQISGPSGELVPATDKNRRFCINDLACGGSVMIFNSERDLMQILDNYNHFFMEESCGICTPCRGGNFILRKQLDRINNRIADQLDMENLHRWSKIMQYSSRCGLGKTAPKSLQQAIERFPDYFESRIHSDGREFNREFDFKKAVSEYDDIVNRED